MEIKDLITDTELQECLELVEDTVANKDITNRPEVGEDKKMTCIDCGKEFVFTVGEQEFYKSKNFLEPKRCKKCSKKRRRKFLNFK